MKFTISQKENLMLYSQIKYSCITFKKLKSFFTEYKELFVTKADKGGTIVVMNRFGYYDKMCKLLDAEDTYRKLKKNPIKSIKNKISELVKKL